jgi:hypothetical protein
LIGRLPAVMIRDPRGNPWPVRATSGGQLKFEARGLHMACVTGALCRKCSIFLVPDQ